MKTLHSITQAANITHGREAKMRRLLKIFMRLLALVFVLAGGLAAWLHFAPPDLIRVGSAYTAKIVCSNVFIAGRDADQVLQVDVQAPGHPLLRLMRLAVDRNAGTVRAGLFGLFGKSLAVHQPGLGCTNVAAGDENQLLKQALPKPAASAAAGIWPQGEEAAPSQDPGIAKVLDDAALQGPGMRAIVVVQNGRIIGERYGDGFDAKTPLLGWSMTKTVNAAIVGTLVRDGKLKLDQDGVLALWAGDGRRKITLANLLAMSAGLIFNEEYGDVTDVTRMLFLEGDMALFATEKPLEAKPGLKWNYSSGTAVLLSRIWQNAVGVDALSFPQKALFGPLGMASAVFETDQSGTFVGSSYLYATARDWARFGEFLRLDGAWNGQQIMPAEFVKIMRAPVAVSDTAYGPQYGQGQLWLRGPEGGTAAGQDPDAGFDLPDDTFWLLGHDGQSTVIIPSKGLVVVRMGLTPSKLSYKPQGLVKALNGALEQSGKI
jgi:CubicO group peptidase (beta-lactamase class C family)